MDMNQNTIWFTGRIKTLLELDGALREKKRVYDTIMPQIIMIIFWIH